MNSAALGMLSLIPPVAAIGLALWKRQLLFALFMGVWLGEVVLKRGNIITAFAGVIDRSLGAVRSPGNLEIILFSLLVGGLMALIKESNGFTGFIHLFDKKGGRRRETVSFLPFLVGISIFIENYSNILINGSINTPLFDRFNISRERLGYFIHTISTNFVALVVINSWGAFYISLLQTQNITDPLKVVIKSIPFNFYCLLSLITVLIVMKTSLTIGPMKKAEIKASSDFNPHSANNPMPEGINSEEFHIPPRAFNLIFPITVLLATVILGLYFTGKGDISQGSGAASVLYGVVTAIICMAILLLVKSRISFAAILNSLFKGIGELFPVGALLVLALTLGDLCSQMGTGVFLAGITSQHIPSALIPAILFIVGCLISFATGTSYGTFAILVPIAVPMAQAAGMPIPLMFAACISGGVFGDNCSPISDTTIITGLSAGIEVIEHIRTQLPYAVLTAILAVIAFVVAGFTA